MINSITRKHIEYDRSDRINVQGREFVVPVEVKEELELFITSAVMMEMDIANDLLFAQINENYCKLFMGTYDIGNNGKIAFRIEIIFEGGEYRETLLNVYENYVISYGISSLVTSVKDVFDKALQFMLKG